MHMLRSKYILFTIFLLSVASVSAQKAEQTTSVKETVCLMTAYL